MRKFVKNSGGSRLSWHKAIVIFVQASIRIPIIRVLRTIRTSVVKKERRMYFDDSVA